MNRIQMISMKTRLGIARDVKVEPETLRARWRSHEEARARAAANDAVRDDDNESNTTLRRRA